MLWFILASIFHILILPVCEIPLRKQCLVVCWWWCSMIAASWLLIFARWSLYQVTYISSQQRNIYSSQDLFTNNFSIVVQISYKFHFAVLKNYNKGITTKFCTLHNSCAIVACAKMCSGLTARKCIKFIYCVNHFASVRQLNVEHRFYIFASQYPCKALHMLVS